MKHANHLADIFMATPSIPSQPRQGKPLLPYAQALSLLEARLGNFNPGLEKLPLEQGVGRVLAKAVGLDRMEPPVARSAMDGYAMQSADGLQPRQVVGTYFAGTAGQVPLQAGQAVAVMTGGTVPEGADCVVPVENIRRQGDQVLVEEAPRSGRHVRVAGEMGAQGRVLLQPGRRLRAADLGALAGCGAHTLTVFRKPRAVVIATGDEVVPYHESPQPHQVRDSNRLLACLQLEAFGAEVVGQCHVLDQPEALRQAVAEALEKADLLLTIGGVSMGEKDYLPQVLAENGVEQLFHKIALQPGKPVWAGEKAGRFVLGLPGNPLSSFVVLELLGRLLVDRLEGGRCSFPRPLRMARLQGEVHSGTRPRLLPARFAVTQTLWQASAVPPDAGSLVEGLPVLQPCAESGSGDWTSLARADALLFLHPQQRVQVGGVVFYLPLEKP